MKPHTAAKRLFTLFALLVLFVATGSAQLSHTINPYTNEETDKKRGGFASDSVTTIDVPEGIYAWRLNQRFGDTKYAEYDTIPHRFQNENQTIGPTAHYINTGNLGAPRLSLFFNEQGLNMQQNPFIFKLPYDYFLTSEEELLFTNTKSPFTNLTYHSCGNKTNGEDRFKALFSVNAGKKLGMGFKIDYLYGRGYYTGQSTSMFDATVFSSYRSDRYNMHFFVQHNYMKNRENGGIESDDYITRPESFSTSYGTADMPINLDRAWNKIGGNKVFLTHRYSLGFYRYRDVKGNVVKDAQKIIEELSRPKIDSAMIAKIDSTKPNQPRVPKDQELTDAQRRKNALDSLKITSEFVPVSSFIHTMKIDDNTRKFMSNETNTSSNPGYFADFYLDGETAFDRTHHFGLENTFAMELHEGMNKWMKMGFRLYGKHELAHFDFKWPNLESEPRRSYNENYITLGAQILSQQSRIYRYNVLGEIRTTGADWGEFNVEGDLAFNIPIKGDSLKFIVDGFVRNERPSFYFRHYYARNAWWENNDLKKMFHARVGATLRYKDTRLTATLENIQNYTYFQETLTENESSTGTYPSYMHSIQVAQASKNVQLIGVTLAHNFHFGIFGWDNEFTYQVSSNQREFPVPAFTAYSNAYIKFSIARVLHTELGVDVSYFTRYKAPTYSPIIGQYAVQDANYATAVGNYPIVNAYVNFHLKRTRFYLKASHLNYSSGSGRPFLVAHYPLNRMTIHFGVSWNFIN